MALTGKAGNRFYTILVMPEKTGRNRNFVVPAWALRGIVIGGLFIALIAVVMLLNYWYVMNQIGENKDLKLENRRLKQQVQIFKSKMETVESTLERVKTFATRLKVITNIEDHGGLLQSLADPKDHGANDPKDHGPDDLKDHSNEKLPDANVNIGKTPAKDAEKAPGQALLGPESEEVQLAREYDQLDGRVTELGHESLYVEQMLHDEYELLGDQKAFLAALPTRKPAVGYFTSGFGIRKSPYGGAVKMHEGLDIANRPGTPIRAPADGIVTFADTKSGYGQVVILDHGYGLETWYGHTRKILVRRGQRVRRGDTIALLGNSGRSTGPHVHYEVRVHGIPVDPLSYILEN